MRDMASSTEAVPDTAIMSVRGVMTSPTVTSSRRITFVTIFHSSSSIVPSLKPSCASTSSSARLVIDPLVPLSIRLKKLRGTKTGFIRMTIQCSRWADGLASSCQKVAPIVLGTIAEKSRMIRVSTAVNTPIQASPKTRAAREPPSAAPAV